MLNKSEVFIKDINTRGILNFLKKCKETGTDVHRLEIAVNDEIKAQIAVSPYSLADKQQLYSLSKSFTSTAIGFLYDEGKISPDDYLIDIFADRITKEPCENMKKMQIKHLLSMTTGHKNCVLHEIKDKDDPVTYWFKTYVDHTPGTYFCYNNAATYMLSETVTKLTGMTLHDYLSEKLFMPLSVKDTIWGTFLSGKSQGAVGLNASIDDITKLGMLYLNKGMWQGKRILSEDWVNMATSFQSDNTGNGTADWTAGYGYQFWLNAKEGFRGDGACGQLVVVYPANNTVISVQSYSDDMQKEMDCVNELYYDLNKESDITTDELLKELESYNMPDRLSTNLLDNLNVKQNTIYTCHANDFGITRLYFEEDETNVSIAISDGKIWQRINMGKQCYKESRINLPWFKPILDFIMTPDRSEDICMMAAVKDQKSHLAADFKYADSPHTQQFEAVFNDNGSTFEIYKYSNPAERRIVLSGKL